MGRVTSSRARVSFSIGPTPKPPASCSTTGRSPATSSVASDAARSFGSANSGWMGMPVGVVSLAGTPQEWR